MKLLGDVPEPFLLIPESLGDESSATYFHLWEAQRKEPSLGNVYFFIRYFEGLSIELISHSIFHFFQKVN